MQVRIQKDSEVRLKIVGTRVDATEIVSLVLSPFSNLGGHLLVPALFFCWTVLGRDSS